MRDAVQVPVTVKCRIGIDDQDSYEFFTRFVDAVVAAGVDALIVHARAPSKAAWQLRAGAPEAARRALSPRRTVKSRR